MAVKLLEKVAKLLEKKEFVYVATCNLNSEPHAIPKFFLKTENNSIYLADFIISQMYDNLKVNPKASVTVMDHDTLHGYRLNGSVSIIEQGPEFDQMVKELRQKQMSLTIERVVRAVQTGVKHENFELAFPDKLAIFKIHVEIVTEVSPRGKLHREKVS